MLETTEKKKGASPCGGRSIETGPMYSIPTANLQVRYLGQLLEEKGGEEVRRALLSLVQQQKLRVVYQLSGEQLYEMALIPELVAEQMSLQLEFLQPASGDRLVFWVSVEGRSTILHEYVVPGAPKIGGTIDELNKAIEEDLNI